MRTAHLLFSALHFFLLTILCLGGVFSLGMFYSPVLRMRVVDGLLHTQKPIFLVIGIGILVFGLLLVLLSMRLYRTQYYQVQMGFPCHNADVDLDVVRSLLGRYWQNHFPSVSPKIDVLLRDDATLELFVELPFLPDEEQKSMMEKIEGDLSRQLARHLNYRKPFFLTVSTVQ